MNMIKGIKPTYLRPCVNRSIRTTCYSMGTNDKFFLFHSKDFSNLAEKMKKNNKSIQLGKIKWNKFGDGFPNLFIENAKELRNSHVAFLASFQNPSDIFEQFSLIYAFPKLFLRSFTLVLPYFPTGTHERMEDEGDIATASTMARMISNIPQTRGGPANVIIYDIHALQERFFFGDNVLPLFESGIPLLLDKLKNLKDEVSIVYPDSGAWKRFHKMFKDYPEIICNKVRDGDNRIVQIKEGDVRDKHVVIVDDLVQSGGTLVECYNVLKKAGAKKVSMYVTHAVFPNENWRKFQKMDIEYFWITDSCPLTINDIRLSSYQKVKPFEILSLSDSINDSLII